MRLYFELSYQSSLFKTSIMFQYWWAFIYSLVHVVSTLFVFVVVTRNTVHFDWIKATSLGDQKVNISVFIELHTFKWCHSCVSSDFLMQDLKCFNWCLCYTSIELSKIIWCLSFLIHRYCSQDPYHWRRVQCFQQRVGTHQDPSEEHHHCYWRHTFPSVVWRPLRNPSRSQKGR